jgi:hypothetical protein
MHTYCKKYMYMSKLKPGSQAPAKIPFLKSVARVLLYNWLVCRHTSIQHFQSDPTTMQCHGCQTEALATAIASMHIHRSHTNWNVWTVVNWHSHAIHKRREKASRNAEMINIHISFSHSQPWAFIGTGNMSEVGDKLRTRTHVRIHVHHTHTALGCTCDVIEL